MSSAASAFSRKLSPENLGILQFLAAAAEPNWLQEALADPEVFFALRNNRVDAYFGGALIYRVDFNAGDAVPQTHVKYLIREPRKGQEYVSMRGNGFDYDPLQRMQTEYRLGSSLKEIKSASSYYAQVERNGVHRVIVGDPFVVDVELSIVQSKGMAEGDVLSPEPIEEEMSKQHDRIDIVRLEPFSGGHNLVFWEAKHYSNAELFGDGVLKQVERYRRQIERHEHALVDQYRTVCGFQAQILRMRQTVTGNEVDSDVIEMLEGIGNLRTTLAVDLQPRIFAFGFDKEQKEYRWKSRMKVLQNELGADYRVRAIGVPKGGSLGAKYR